MKNILRTAGRKQERKGESGIKEWEEETAINLQEARV